VDDSFVTQSVVIVKLVPVVEFYGDKGCAHNWANKIFVSKMPHAVLIPSVPQSFD